LRLLAHGLRTLQQIAGRRAGPPPELAAIQTWARQQPSIGDDETFVSAFSIQLEVAGQQLSQLAGDRPGGALALELSDLTTWATASANDRLAIIPPTTPLPGTPPAPLP
jgi:hypothetical protein